MNDKRPDPKPKKHIALWQSYLIWYELVEMRKRHLLRLSSIEAGKSNFNPDIENKFIEIMNLDESIAKAKSTMIEYGEELGDIWNWMIEIKGLGEGGLNAQLLAQIDDVGKFDTISKLWAFSGYSVRDGHRIYSIPGEKCPFNKHLKSVIWLIGDQFVKQRTPIYRDLYNKAKDEYRRQHPVKIVENGKTKYNDGHIDNMARRIPEKIFLQHVWVIWRESEGLPVTLPYAQAILGHEHYVEPSRT